MEFNYPELSKQYHWDKTPFRAGSLMTIQDDAFCLAITEYNGNVGLAYTKTYGDVAHFPAAAARELLARPDFAARIAELQASITEYTLISLGAHLVELSEIRDLAKITRQLRVAFNAERSRGEAAGFYKSLESASQTPQEQASLAREAIRAALATTGEQ